MNQFDPTIGCMNTLLATSQIRRLFGYSIVARMPIATLSVGVLLHVQGLTGSFAAAGVAAAALAAGEGVGGPLLGRMSDRRGQTAVLIAGAVTAAGALLALALLPVGTPLAAIVVPAAVAGLAVPPVGACLRALLPRLVADGAALQRAYAAEATGSELTWIAGPPVMLLLATGLSTRIALAAAAGALLVFSVAFALQPTARTWRPAPRSAVRRGGSLASPAVRTLVAILMAVGVVFGAVEVAVTVAATSLGSTAAAGPLLGVWGAGSLAGGAIVSRRGGGPRTGAGLAALLLGLAVGHMALAAATGSAIAMALVLALAGAAIAPTYASVNAMVERAAPAGTVTEAFAWLNTAVGAGTAVGSAIGGALAAGYGAGPTFLFAGTAGLASALLALRYAPMRTVDPWHTPRPVAWTHE